MRTNADSLISDEKSDIETMNTCKAVCKSVFFIEIYLIWNADMIEEVQI